ncbi:MAG: hypothetical protein M1828_002016 [Chrysothrix sp. TS-e1954]|nr:MAG: hypothetical protein M1828_002016 [Chrysothrix sp. TS-e1954]
MASHRADAKYMLDDRGYTGHLIRGQAPYLLIEEAVRNRITNSYYWKEQCFGLNAATLCDRAAELTYVGGTYNSGQRASPFLCLAFKMLQLGVEKEIVDEYLINDDFKYLRALACFYVRLTAEDSVEVHKRLEGYLEDSRKLRRRGNQGWGLIHIDEFVDNLLTKDRVCGTSFWKLVPRQQLEDEDKLDERVSPVAHMLEEENEASSTDERELQQKPQQGKELQQGSKPQWKLQ